MAVEKGRQKGVIIHFHKGFLRRFFCFRVALQDAPFGVSDRGLLHSRGRRATGTSPQGPQAQLAQLGDVQPFSWLVSFFVFFVRESSVGGG